MPQPNDWQTVSEPDDWETVTDSAPVEEQNWYDTAASYVPQPVKSAWDWLWEPKTDAPTRAGKSISDYLDPLQYPEWNVKRPWDIRRFAAAYPEALGNVVSDLTSPGNIGLGVATGGAGLASRAALPRVAAAASGAARTGGALTAAHGVQTMANPEASMLEKGMGALETVGGGLVARSPVVRPRTAVANVAEELPVRQPAAAIEPAAITPEAMPVRALETPPTQPMAGEFDPSTLKGLEPAPRPAIDFVDPKTGQIKSAVEAKPGDVPIIPEEPKWSHPINEGELSITDRVGNDNFEIMPSKPRSMSLREEVGRDYIEQPLSNREMGQHLTDRAARENADAAIQASREQSAPTLPHEFQPVETVAAGPTTSQHLQNAKPRFGIGTNFYNPKFSNDLDKALYVISQSRQSSRRSEYLKFIMEETGLDEATAVALGKEVKAATRQFATGKSPGDINIPQMARGRVTSGGGGKPPKPPIKKTTGGELPEPPQPPKPTGATEVTASLNKRLQDAVDNAGTPRIDAPEQISQLLDEATETINQLPNGPEKQGWIRKTLGANRAFLTSWDLSAPGRQGKAFIFNKAYWTSIDDMIKAWGSKAAADNIQQSIFNHQSGYFKRPVSETGKVGKSFADKIGLDLASTEEMFRSTFGKQFEKRSGIAMASRAHTAFLNKLRSDQFVSMMDAAKRAGIDPETNLELAKGFAKFINDGTGRGSLNIGKWKLERNMGVLNDVFFAPKNMAGQIRTWNNVLNPVKYYNYDPVLRKQALRSLFAVAGMGLGVGEIARLAGAQVSNDPTNTDFRKIKVGDTRIDPFGGYQQFPVAAMKFLSGQSTSSISGKTTDLNAGKYGQQTQGSIASRFFTNRLSPAGSFIWAWMNNKEFDGKPFEYKRAVYERVFPIAMKDIYELSQENPALAAALAIPTTTGLIGTQHYTGR